jgi:hypothetical protein
MATTGSTPPHPSRQAAANPLWGLDNGYYYRNRDDLLG